MAKEIKIDPYGFREYDARWLYEKDINEAGIEDLGKGLGTQIIKHTKKNNPRVIIGHDYRSYSEEIKKNLKKGLLSTGCNIEDIGLSLSPTVYFAQFNLNADAVAMVTASHNENGWTGVKMGIKKGLTHAPEEMKELKEITLQEKFVQGKGNKKEIKNFDKIYKEDLIKKNKIKKKIKAVVACGNGTAGIFAPDILRQIGCEVIELDCNLDWTFPKYNPNPEDLKMLHEIAEAVRLIPDRYQGLGTIPIKDPERSISELNRLMSELHLKGIIIGSHIDHQNLNHDHLLEILKEAEKLGAFILLHPLSTRANAIMGDYHLINLIGNPMETTTAAANLIFSGFIDKLPKIKICLSHAGGYLPFAIGRFDHAYSTREDVNERLVKKPSEYLSQFYYDTITHSDVGLNQVIDIVGSDRILLGTDFPADICDI